MHREWKTWPQIATMVLDQIKSFPCGERLIWIEFKDFDDENGIASFVIETDGASDFENTMIADYIAIILKKMRHKYKISSLTVH